MATGDLAYAPFNHQHPFPPDLRMQRDTINARDVISAPIRWEGMLVYVLENQKTYQLQGGLTNEYWVEFLGSEGGSISNAVLYTIQTLTPAEQLQARLNIGAGELMDGLISLGPVTSLVNDVTIDSVLARIDGMNVEVTDPTTIAVPVPAAGYVRRDLIVIDGSGLIYLVQGTEVPAGQTAITPDVPNQTVVLVETFSNDTGLQDIYDFAYSSFVRFDIDTQGLSPAQRLNARTNIQALSRDTNDTRFGSLVQNGLFTLNGDYVQVVVNDTASFFAWQFSNPSGGGANFQRRGGLTITSKGDSMTNYFILRGYDNNEVEVFRVRQGGVTMGGDAINANDFTTLGQVQGLITGSEGSEVTEMSGDDFFVGYRVNGAERIEQIFDKDDKDVIVDDTGIIILNPTQSVGNFIFTGSDLAAVTEVRGIETAIDGREIHLTNRSGAIIPLIDGYVGGPPNSAFDFGGVNYNLAIGETISLIGNGTEWVQNTLNYVAFSDNIDSVNAEISIGPDGLQVISGVQDVNTGANYNYKEYTSIPSIVDGNIFIQLGVKYFKRVFTTPIDLESVGIKYNDETAAVSNMALIAILLNMDQPICVKNKMYITANSPVVTANNILIYGDNDLSEIVSTGSGTLAIINDTIDTFIVENIKVTCNTGLFWFFNKSGVDFIADKVILRNVIGEGNITLRIAANTTTYASKINYIGIIGGKYSNNSNTFFSVVDVKYDMAEILNVQVRNFLYTFFYNSLSGSGEIKEDLKLLKVDNCNVINSIDYFKSAQGSSIYYAFVLTEAYESVYTNNHVEGIKSTVDVAIYDIYQSSKISRYERNTYKNNMSFVPVTDNGTKALYKQKGGKQVDVNNNRFIIEKSFLDEFIAANSGLALNLADCWAGYISLPNDEVNPPSTNYKNNEVDVYILDNQILLNKTFKNFIVENNTFSADSILYDFMHIRNSLDTGNEDRFFSFSNNTIDPRDGNFTGHIIRGSQGSAVSATPSKIRMKLENNVIKNMTNYALYLLTANYINISNNEFYYTSGQSPSVAYYVVKAIDEMSGSGNKIFIKDGGTFNLARSHEYESGEITNEILLTNSNTIAGIGLIIWTKGYNYTIGRKFEINSEAYGNIHVNINFEHEFDGTNNFFNYFDYDNMVSYRIQYTNPLTFGNGSTHNHLIFTLKSPKTGVTFGTIRFYVTNNLPVLCLILTNPNNYRVKITDYVYR